MDLLQLKYFRDAARYENFSKTAEVNIVSQPSISKAIKSLETELGVPLFDRTGKKIYLNENGRYFYENVSTVLNILDECTEYFSHAKPHHISLYIQNGSFFLPSLLADFTLTNTNALITTPSVREVMRSPKNSYDLTFMELLDDMSNYRYEHLLDDELVLLVSTQHPLSQFNEIDITQAQPYSFVSYYPTIVHRILSDRLCTEVGNFKPNYIYETHDEFSVLHLIESNVGISIMPEKFYNVHKSDKVNAIKIKNTISSHLIIAWNKDKILSTTEKSFLDYTKKWFANL